MFIAPSKGLWGLVIAVLIIAVAAEEKASKVAVAISATLIGAISFQMMLFYLVNWNDADIKKYSYQTISSTISIFCAVLLFQTFNDVVEIFLLDGTSLEFQLVIDLGHMLFWFGLMQLALAWISGAVGGKPKSMKQCEMNMKCWALLLAHMTGFAAINGWGTLQQFPIFTDFPPLTFMCAPIAIGGLYLLTKTTDKVREKVALGDDGKEDAFEKLWDEETEESENDVLGLAISFLLTQAIRYNISGLMPNQEGEEEGPEAGMHDNGQVWSLFLAAMAFVGCTVATLLLKPSEEVMEEQPWKERIFSGTLTTVSMGFAWCTFFSCRWFFSGYLYLLGEPMLLATILAIFLSFASFSVILVLDKIADADWTGDKADEIIIQIINAIGILVGFAWEQCFDCAVGALASVSPLGDLFTKILLTLFCVIIIVPAWRGYMLPMVVEEGWRFGFVVSHEKLMKGFEELVKFEEEEMKAKQSKKKGGKEGAAEGGKGGYVPPPEK